MTQKYDGAVAYRSASNQTWIGDSHFLKRHSVQRSTRLRLHNSTPRCVSKLKAPTRYFPNNCECEVEQLYLLATRKAMSKEIQVVEQIYE